MPGKVYLVGAGPGDPELLTVKALKALKTADVVLHDALISAEILAFVPRSARVHDVGKRCGGKSTPQHEINSLLINYARLDFQVVRLKGGDPLIFGRAGEEMEALRKAGIDFEVIPGVTALSGAAAVAQIPMTHREISSSLVILTGRHSHSSDDHDWPATLPSNATVVVYMPGNDYEKTAKKLLRAGLKKSTACAVISQATSQEERVHRTTIGGLNRSPRLAAPTLLVVGDVSRLADHASLRESAPGRTFDDRELVSLLTRMESQSKGQPFAPDQERSE